MIFLRAHQYSFSLLSRNKKLSLERNVDLDLSLVPKGSDNTGLDSYEGLLSASCVFYV